jgi:glycogenin glucosyltransferase
MMLFAWLCSKQPGYWEAVKPLKIIHFSSSPKPWTLGAGATKGELEMMWWQEYLATKVPKW